MAQVFFRAASCGQAAHLLAALIGLHGVEHNSAAAVNHGTHILAQSLDHLGVLTIVSAARIKQFAQISGSLLLCWFSPNTQQIMARAKPVLGILPPPAPRLLQWQPSGSWAAVTAAGALLAALSLGGTTEFLYFQF